MPSTKSSRLLLLVTAAIWGFAFVAQRAGMTHLGPMAFNTIRFGMGALVLFPVFKKYISRSYLSQAVLAGSILFAGASLQQWGVVYTTAGKAGFITGLYIVFVPVLGLVTGHREGKTLWAGIVLSLAGLWLLSFSQGFKSVNPGDLLVLGGAVMWAIHVRLIGRYAGRYHPGGFAVVQFTTVTVLSAATTLFVKESWSGIPAAWLPLAYSGVLSVGIAFTIQIFAQKNVRPAPAAIIMSLEAVFAAIGGSIVLKESLTATELSGAALMFAGMIVAQIPARHR
ncbi:MAG: DMT family transporter [Candidatus Fermentibacteraceae bacterium]|nr:DMT family transporter [Candidatus Fermentibacteraceae bacterium]